MSNKINDGGPAFPSLDLWIGAERKDDASQGMTIRDWFAGMALQGIAMYERGQGIPWAEKASTCLKDSADMSYQLADAMLKAREVRHD